MQNKLLRLFPLLALLFTLASAGLYVAITEASGCQQWYHCTVTQHFKQNQEHGVDLATHGLAITAWRSGTITFIGRECWENPCIEDITWQLDFPSHAGGSKYMYVQIASVAKGLHVGQHVVDGQLLGGSTPGPYGYIEFGLTPNKAYGVSGWDYGIDPLRLWPWL